MSPCRAGEERRRDGHAGEWRGGERGMEGSGAAFMEPTPNGGREETGQFRVSVRPGRRCPNIKQDISDVSTFHFLRKYRKIWGI